MKWLEKIIDKLIAVLPATSVIGPNEMGVRVTCGKIKKTLGPGFYVYWPLMQDIESMEVINQVVDLPPQTAQTKDGHDVVVSGALLYNITDINKALFEIYDLDKALVVVAQGSVLNFVASRTLDELKQSDEVRTELRREVASDASGWGVKIKRAFTTEFAKVKSYRIYGQTTTLPLENENG